MRNPFFQIFVLDQKLIVKKLDIIDCANFAIEMSIKIFLILKIDR